MAQRKQDLANKISTQSDVRPGWRDTITGVAPTEARRPAFIKAEPQPEPAAKIKRKTYLLYAGMIEEIETLAAREQVGINDLVRYLLGAALDQVYEGKITIPTQPGQRQIAP